MDRPKSHKPETTLVFCPECDGSVSPKARNCLHCGSPEVRPRGIGRLVYIVGSLLTFILFAMPYAYYLQILAIDFPQYDLTMQSWYYLGLLLAIFLTSLRLRNAKINPWWSILLVIPFVNLGLFLFAATRKSKTANKKLLANDDLEPDNEISTKTYPVLQSNSSAVDQTSRDEKRIQKFWAITVGLLMLMGAILFLSLIHI